MRRWREKPPSAEEEEEVVALFFLFSPVASSKEDLNIWKEKRTKIILLYLYL